jgi:hypothetical protein
MRSPYCERKGIKLIVGGLAFAVVLAMAQLVGAQNSYTWNVTSGNWSAPGSWSPSANPAGPQSFDSAIFGNDFESSSPTTVNNTVDSSFAGTVADLTYSDFEPSGSYVYPVTLIPANKTLIVTSDFVVGGQSQPSGNYASFATMVGGGTLKVTAPNFFVANGGSANGACAFLDLSGLTNFIYNNPNGSIGISTNGGPLAGFTRFAGAMILASGSNNITAAALNLGTSTSAQGGPGLLVSGVFGGGVQNNTGPLPGGNPEVLTLGPGTNIINANAITIANQKYGFIITNSGGGIRIRGITGADSDNNVNITVGNRNVSGGSGQTTGWLMFNGCPVDIKANSLVVGERIAGTSNGSNGGDAGNGMLQFDTGTISANSLLMAYNAGSSYSPSEPSQANGLIQVGAHATLLIGAGQVFALASSLASGPSTGTLIVSNGLINCQGPIVMGPGTNSVPPSSAGLATGIIQLIGAGTLNMGPNSYIGSITNPITALILDTDSVFSISIPSATYTNVCVQNLSWPSPDTDLTLSVAAIPAGITNNEVFPFLNFTNTTGSVTVTVPGAYGNTNVTITPPVFNNPKLVLPTGVTGYLSLPGGGNTIFLTITSGAGLGQGGVNQLTNAYFISGSTNWAAMGNGASIVSTDSTYPNTDGCTVDTRNIVALPGTGKNVAKLTGSFVAGGSTNIWSQSVPVFPVSQITPGASVLTPGAQITVGGSTYVAHEDIMSGADSFYYELDFLDTNGMLLAAYESSVLSNLNCGSPILDIWNDMAVTNQMQVTGGVNTGVVISNTSPMIRVPPHSATAQFKAVFIQRNATDSGSVYFSGANVGYLSAPVPPTVSSVTPDLVTLCTNNFLTCTATSTITTLGSVQVTTITTTLAGSVTNTTVYTDGSAGLTVTGLGTPSADISLVLATNTIYQSVVVQVTDADGETASSSPVSFDTLVPNLVMEAADFNYSGGQFIDTPPNGGFALYQGKVGTTNIDEFKITRTGTQSYYRPSDATIIQAANSTSGTEQKFVTAAANGDTNDIEVAIAYDSVGDWQNYSRTVANSGGSIQSGTYNVWCYLATSGSGPQVGFYQVTSDPTMTGQTTNVIGSFGGSTFSDNSYTRFVYAPLVDQFGNRVALTITNGVQTFRGQIINSDSPNVGFYMFVPIVPVLNPVFLYGYPNGSYESTNSFTFIVGPAQGASIATNGIGITLNGVPITSGLIFSPYGSGGWMVTVPIQLNQLYSVDINVTNMDGLASSYSTSFDTFSQTNLMIEAGDFDFNGGEFIDNPLETATSVAATNSYYYYPGGNPNNGAVYGVDFTTTNVSITETYLYRVDGNGPGGNPAAGTEVTSDSLRDKLINLGPGAQPPFEYVPGEPVPTTNTDFDVGWWPPGTWLNYTRTFPTNTYHVWGRLAAGAPYAAATMSLVTSGQGTPNQTTQLLGAFSDTNANGFQSWHWIPLMGTNGQPAVVSLGGVETLKVTAPPGSATGSLNAHFYMFAPFVPSAVPMSLSASISGGLIAIKFPTESGYSYTVQYSSSLSPANWQTLTTVSGDGTIKTVTDTMSGAQQFYRVEAQ